MGCASAAVVFALASATSESPPTEAECRALGFAPSLLCSSCVKLGEFIPADDPLLGECEQCCTPEAAGAGAFARATLDVCK